MPQGPINEREEAQNMSDIIFSFNVIMPVFMIVFLGIILKRKRMIDEHFVTVSSSLVFNITIPALIFINIAEANFSQAFQGKMILFAMVSVLLSFLLLYYLTFWIKDSKSRGSYIQNSFRSNFAILGFAILYNLFGQSVIAPASILLSFVMLLFNILSIFALIRFRENRSRVDVKHILIEILKNPLVISAFLAIPFSLYSIKLPQFLEQSINYLASLTMPLALIGIGGAMSFRSMKKDMFLIVSSTLIKIVFLPLIFTFLAVIMGIRGQNLGILFVLFASPTAIVSFIMAKAMDSNSVLAANVILLSTLASVFTLGGGIFLLRFFGLI